LTEVCVPSYQSFYQNTFYFAIKFKLRGLQDFDSELVADKKKALDFRSWLCCEYSKITLVTKLYG